MTARLAGAVLTLLAGTLLGVQAASALRQRLRLLTDWEAALRVMEAELSFRLPPLPELLDRSAAAVRPPVSEALCRCGEALRRGEPRPFFLLWREQIQPQLCREERDVLEELGGILGRCAAPEQVQALKNACTRLGDCRERARQELEQKGRLRCVLGTAAGLLTVLVLF